MDNKCQWFKNSPLGMFIHWGIYSVFGRGEWVLNQEQMPLEEYDTQIKDFTAEKFDANAWAETAVASGATYVVLTAKHHDGFCLFDTKTTPRNSCQMGPKKDFIKLYTDACRRHNLKVGIYFSIPDWSIDGFNNGPEQDPIGWEEYVNLTHTQALELMSNYGKIDLLWYDRAGNMSNTQVNTAQNMRSKELNEKIRQLQPDIIINDRSGLDEDFYTAEQNLTPPKDPNRIWEGCLTMRNHWGYFPSDFLYKTPFEIAWKITAVAYSGGHILLNAGPKPNGEIPEIEVETFQAVGNWIKKNKEAIVNVQKYPLPGGTYGCAVSKDNNVYLYIHWQNDEGKVVVPKCSEKFVKAEVLEDGTTLNITYDNFNRMIITGLNKKYLLPIIKLYR
jgi:alpha-L-fucosidase